MHRVKSYFMHIAVIVVIYLTSNAFAAMSDFMITSESEHGKYELDGEEWYEESSETFLEDDLSNIIGNSEMNVEMLQRALKQLMSDERYSEAIHQAFPENVIEQINAPGEYGGCQADYDQYKWDDYNQQPSNEIC